MRLEASGALPSFETRFALLRMRARYSVPAMLPHPSCCSRTKKKAPQTDGRHFIFSSPKKGRRSAERRTSGTCIAKRCRRGHLRPLAFRRSSAVMRWGYSPQLGLGRASWNRRMQTGGPSPTPVQQAPCSPITRRTGRCPNRLRTKVTGSRPQEPLRFINRSHRPMSLTTSGIAPT
jgi:hypothetical protein